MSKKPNLSSKLSAQVPAEAADEPNILSSGMGSPPVSHGKKTEAILPDDDQNTQFLTQQRLADAEEDLRREARHAQDRNDSK